MHKKLWTPGYTKIICSTIMGAIGNTASSVALSFLVFEETSSTFAATVIAAMRLIPGLVIPLVCGPMLDRLPRKPFLVGCDMMSACVCFAAGLWLRNAQFDYMLYLMFQLVFACLGSFDQLTYNAFFAKLIPQGFEDEGYAFSSMLYPMITVIMTPVGAWLYTKIGVGMMLMLHSLFCLCASAIESTIKIGEEVREGTDFSLRQWIGDLKEAIDFIRKDEGLTALTVYSGITNGTYPGCEALLVAFFSTSPGFSLAMYSMFTVFENIGRAIGGVVLNKRKLPNERKYGYSLGVYLTYDISDILLLWIPYPVMLLNRTLCGYLGIHSGTLRYAAMQKYIPDEMRARVSGLQEIIILILETILSLVIGFFGDLYDYRIVFSATGAFVLAACLLTIVRKKKAIEKIYTYEPRIDQ